MRALLCLGFFLYGLSAGYFIGRMCSMIRQQKQQAKQHLYRAAELAGQKRLQKKGD